MGDFHAWTRQQLQNLLAFEGVNDIMEHMMRLDDKELATYLHVCYFEYYLLILAQFIYFLLFVSLDIEIDILY